jgi:hypothetical protein
MRRVVPAALSLALLAALGSAANAAGKDRAISTDTTATNVSAYEGSLVWSRQAAAGKHRLVTFTTLPVPLLGASPGPTDVANASSDSPFDPDLGRSATGSSGRLVVVYTRCAGVSGRSCDIQESDGKHERKVPGASSRRCSEFAPSIWKGTVAFARSGPGRCDGLYVKGRRGKALRLDKRVPADTDIRAGKVAYLHFPSRGKSVIRVFTIKEGRSRAVITGFTSQGERTRVTNPTFAGPHVYWLLEDLRRHDLTIGRSRGGPHSVLEWIDRKLPASLDSFAVDGRSVFYTDGRGVYVASDPVPRFATRD